MIPTLRIARIAFVAVCSATLSANAAPDKLARVKTGKARETPLSELSQSLDGLQGASSGDLKSHCGSLKKEREVAEKEFEERARESRAAEGSRPEAGGSPGRPRSAAASMAAKNALAEAMVRRTVLGCHLLAVQEMQDARAKRRTVRTKDLLTKCLERQEAARLMDLTCDGGEEPAPRELERK